MRGGASVFDSIGKDDLILAFFPCTYFCDFSQILHTWGAYAKHTKRYASDKILERSRFRQKYYELAVKLLTIAEERKVRLIMENPLGMHSYIRSCFITQPKLVDKHRNLRGDYFAKPTGYWFIHCEPTDGESLQYRKPKLVKKDVKGSGQIGICNEERSMMHPDYARNFICDFVIGKEQKNSQLQLF